MRQVRYLVFLVAGAAPTPPLHLQAKLSQNCVHTFLSLWTELCNFFGDFHFWNFAQCAARSRFFEKYPYVCFGGHFLKKGWWRGWSPAKCRKRMKRPSEVVQRCAKSIKGFKVTQSPKTQSDKRHSKKTSTKIPSKFLTLSWKGTKTIKNKKHKNNEKAF